MEIIKVEFGECDSCGSDDVHAETNSVIHGLLRDGDAIRCGSCEATGGISIVDNEAFCVWDESP